MIPISSWIWTPLERTPEINLGNYRFYPFCHSRHFERRHTLYPGTGDSTYSAETAILKDGFLKMKRNPGIKAECRYGRPVGLQDGRWKRNSRRGCRRLSRAFINLQGQSVIVSLWSVESNSTAVLSKNFYSHLMKPEGQERGSQAGQSRN